MHMVREIKREKMKIHITNYINSYNNDNSVQIISIGSKHNIYIYIYIYIYIGYIYRVYI